MRQNRVDPMGALHAVAPRGAWFGNKGCLHSAEGHIVRGHNGKRWITCVCEFRGRRRKLVQPGRYTELFFHDEATAYAAGHRPCAECRYADWKLFATLWGTLFGVAKVDGIDAILQAARLAGKQRRLRVMPAAQIPVGAMCLHAGTPILRANSGWLAWSFDGYAETEPPNLADLSLLTPWPLAQMMAAGLPVQIGL